MSSQSLNISCCKGEKDRNFVSEGKGIDTTVHMGIVGNVKDWASVRLKVPLQIWTPEWDDSDPGKNAVFLHQSRIMILKFS